MKILLIFNLLLFYLILNKNLAPDRKTKATGISPRPTDHNFKCDDMNRITNSIIIRNIESRLLHKFRFSCSLN